MPKLLVFGAAGFIGTHFGKWICSNNIDVELIGVDITSVNADYHHTIIIAQEDFESLDKLIKKVAPTLVLNLAGITNNSSFKNLMQTNAEFSRQLLEASIKHSFIKRILLIGSAAEYGIPISMPVKEDYPCKPVSNYGLSKAIQSVYADFYARMHKCPVVLARTFNIIGLGMPANLSIASFARRISESKTNSTIATGNLASKRDYLHINDVCAAYWALLSKAPLKHSVYNICSGFSVSMQSILNAMIKASGKNLSVRIDSSLGHKNDLQDIFGDNQRIIEETDWRPSAHILDAAAEIVRIKIAKK